MNEILEAALRYETRGFSVFPVRRDKRPYESWKAFQERRPTPEEIREFFHRRPDANVAVATGKISGVVVVDIDTSEGHEVFEGIIPEGLVTPIARTPRGGWHYYFQWPGYEVSNAVHNLPGCDFRGDRGYVVAAPSQGPNGGPGYRWLDGLSIGQVEPAPLPKSYLQFLPCINSYSCTNLNVGEKRIDETSSIANLTVVNNSEKPEMLTNVDNGPEKLTTVDNVLSNVDISFEKGCRDNSLFHTANCLVKGGMHPVNIAKILEHLIISWGEKPSKKWIADKIRSASQREERRERNLTQEIREWVLSTFGNFLSTDVNKELGLSTRDNMKKTSVILGRLEKEGLIERVGKRRGAFRVIDKTEDVVDIFAVEDVPDLGVEFPLNIHDRFETPPCSVVLVAGASNAGKSGFLLDMAYRNRKRFDCYYYSSSSETNPKTLRKRVKAFGYPLDDWREVNFRSKRGGIFADVIRPDALNIIDYLEVHRDFYEVGERIAEISERLKDGVAVIALQKKQGADFAKGGELTREKATTYINLDLGNPQKLSFQKIKYPKTKNAYAPVYFEILNNGSRFIEAR